ncbi:unnamed protein product [Caretta caretta]
MADRSEGAELMLTSGEECEMRVCDTDGEPRGHVAEPTGDVYMARLRARPQALSMETLQGARDGLERRGELGEELGCCLDLALERFSREPRCVQENARMGIRWERGSLEFLSGEGECEISVCYRDGRPQYDIGELPVPMYLDRLQAHPEPLSTDTLWSVRDKLGSCKGDTDDLRACFDIAWEGFRQEPRCVQDNARLLIRWGRRQVTFTSGKGECEITVSYEDGKPQYRVVKIPEHVYVAQLRGRRLSLSTDTLRRVLRELGSCHGDTGALRACFDRVWQGFRQEPRCVQDNARLQIQWGRGELKFVSGQGQCEISVLLTTGEPQYRITELGRDRPVTWSHASPEPLSVADLARVRDRLGRWRALGKELSSCFGEAISQFSREPRCVQGNARVRLCWSGQSLEFLSGEGQYIFSVSYQEGNPCYCLHVETLPVHLYVARLRSRKDPLSADSLLKFHTELGLCRGDTAALRARLHRAWVGYSQEPRCVQENARLLIRWDGGELEFVSGQGQCEISVLLADGEPQYHITELGGDRPVTWSHASPESLSVADLASMRDRLGCWGGLGEELSSCFGEAIARFSREPPSVQENARMRLSWNRGSLEFLSGEGQYIFSVSYQEGNPRYHFHVETLPGDLYVARLRSHKDPLSADSLFKFYTDLGLCRGDTAALRACLYTAWRGFGWEPLCVQENARLLICWDGGELEFVSGQGQCEISVSCSAGEPHYHITETTRDVFVAWTHSHPESLSISNLERVRDRLRCWGALGKELSGCFGEAIAQFSREPPCVQGNARMRLDWDRRSLEFLSGKGQCEISVSCQEGNPRYHFHVETLPVHLYVARLRSRNDPLSADSLLKFHTELGLCRGDTAALRARLHKAWEGFSQEPRCMQENARLLVQWGRRQLTFTSGNGECEISVRNGDGKPQYHVRKIPVHVYVAQLRVPGQSLSVDTLQRVLSELGACHGDTGALTACFYRAWEGFRQEPRCVQENARLLILWDGGELEFVSGQGQCEISVLLADGEPQYRITELGRDRPVTWSHASPEPLSVADLVRVWDRLGRWRALGKELSSCFGEAISQFSQEPRCVQGNARMRIRSDGGTLELLSGEGQCEISVCCTDGRPQYKVGELPVHMYLARLCARPEPLSADGLQRVLRKLGSCQEDTGILRACISHALDQFVQEPRCVQENARLLIRWGGEELELVSGQGQCEISVLLADGEPQYRITELEGDRPVTWSHASPEPLSVADLARVRDRLEDWGALDEELSSCFGEAISWFSREPPCVQENTRMRLCSDRGSLEFLSGEGQYVFSVSYQEGNPRYHFLVEILPVHLYVARLHSRKDPLSADSLLKFHTELGLCRGDTAALRARLHRAWVGYSQEPRCVQENARLLIRWDGGELEFVSGQGQCEISVSCSAGEPQYHITEKTWDVFVAWTHSHPEPLSISNLKRVRNRLRCWGALGKGLSDCFGEAIARFSREPPCVQENARMRLCWDRGSLEFLSGEGQYIFSVSYQEGNPRYHFHVETLPGHLYVARLHSCKDPLSADSLLKFHTELGLCRGDTAALRARLHRAWVGYSQEPRCVQENARLLVRWDEGELEFVSGQGQCEISVSCSAGEPQYHITEKTWDVFVAWTHSHPEPLSISNLERVQDRLRCWGALGKELSGCFGEAIAQFSREPRCVQENARTWLCWDRGRLEFLSGEGQYIFSVSYEEGNPRYHFHVETLPGHLYVARLRFRNDPLSADSLFKFYTELGLCRGDTAALRARLHKAWEGFSQEPRCVQENARLLVQWGRRQLTFTSGNGECEISVSSGDGKPQYHVRKIPVHVYVAQLRTPGQSLSVDTLRRVLSELGACHGDTGALTACFYRAWEGFRQEPRCVQENARLLIQWGREELGFVSGQGQCEISVLLADGRPQYHITELGGDRPVTWLHSIPEPLSIADLARVRDRLGCWRGLGEELSSCFGEAISQFSQEPRCVQDNARLLIQWGTGELEFVSGQGQCEISVLLADGEPQYHITELGRDRPVTWSHASPELLSVADLERVRDRLGRWWALGKELSSCFGEAISQFSQEPRCVQGNARMRIRSDGGTLELLSGEGQCEISVCCRDGRPQYEVGELSVHMYLARLCARAEPLSADILQRVLRKLGSCQEDTGILRACISHALDQFVQEPRCVQENARLLIRWGGEELELVSGQGQCEISVLLADGEPQYHITELGGDRPVTWSHASPEPLSVADLARVWDRLGRWGGLGKELSVCFREAISRFSREPPWVQGNARMGICWDRNRLEFLSGEGQCEISLRYRHGRAQYEVGELPGHINLAQLHTPPEPEHEPPETPHD